MSEATNNPGNPIVEPPKEASDADLAKMLGLDLGDGQKVTEPVEEPVVEEKAEEPAVETEAAVEAESAPEADVAAEPVAKAPDAHKINVDRVVERLFSQYSMSPDAIDAMDDATRLRTADAMAVKVLKRAKIPQRFIDAMSPEERVAEAIPHRAGQRQQDRASRPNELTGEGRRPQPQAKAVEPVATDPLIGVGDELDLLDPAAKQKLLDRDKRVQDELAQTKSELARARERVRASNFADAFVTVLEEIPAMQGQHQAITQALNDDRFTDEDRALLDSGGDGLVELVRRAAEEVGFVPQSPVKEAPKTTPASQARNTPPKPSGRGGTGRAAPKTLTPEQEDARQLRALSMSGFDEVKARELLRTGRV